MLLSTLCFCALVHQQTPMQKDAPGGMIPMVIYQERNVAVNNLQPRNDRDAGQSITWTCLGACNWEVLDGGVQGTPCKIFRGDGKWAYKAKPKKGAFKEDRDASYTVLYLVGLDGIPIHSESHFTDTGPDDYNTIDISADYKTNYIREKITRNGETENRTLYPSFGMERFAGMFEPMMRSGLIQQKDMDCAVLHPYTGSPYEFKLHVRGRFTGDFFSLQQAGYCIDITSDDLKETAFLSRQGQLLKVDLPDRVFAMQMEEPLFDQRRGWGKFSISDWDRPTDETNPERPVYHTLVVPVMFTKPNLLFPVPCAMTD